MQKVKSEKNSYNIQKSDVPGLPGTTARCVLIKGTKHYFVSDLELEHGRGFTAKAGSQVTKARIKDQKTGNSQMRRLITSTGIRQASKRTKTCRK